MNKVELIRFENCKFEKMDFTTKLICEKLNFALFITCNICVDGIRVGKDYEMKVF